MERQQDLMTSQLKPSKLTQRLLPTCCTNSLIRSGRKNISQMNGKKGYLSSYQKRETSEIVTTTGVSCYSQCQARSSTESYWKG